MEGSVVGRSQSLETAKAIAGLLAGAAALIYLTGGAVLALRLLFVGIPGLGVVPGLPREFLFSLGASQVVLPAIVIGAALGVLELGQADERLDRGHLPWWRVKARPRMRWSYVLSYAVLPLLLIAPGAAIALSEETDNDETKGAIWGVVLAGYALALFFAAVYGRFTLPSKEERDELQVAPKLLAREYLVLGASFAVSWGPVGVTGDTNYVGLPAAWVLTLLVVLLCFWLRGEIGERAFGGEKHRTTLTVLSWAVTALLVVPALMTAAAARNLQEAKVCTKTPASHPYSATGLYIGETKERVYVGDDLNDRVIFIPADEVSRVAFGHDAGTTQLCSSPKTEGVPTVTPTPPAETKPTPPTPAADVTGPDLGSVLLVARRLRPDASVLLVFSSVPESLTGVASLVTAGNRQLLIASHSFQRRNPEALRLRFRLSVAAQRRLDREGKLPVKLRLAALDDLGNTSRRCLRFTLARMSDEAPSVC